MTVDLPRRSSRSDSGVKVGIEPGLIEFGVPTFLIAAVVVTALATLVLHLLFPPVKGTYPIKNLQHDSAQDDTTEPIDKPYENSANN